MNHIRKRSPRLLLTLCKGIYPSYTGVHTVCVVPESTTSPVALPLANLGREEGREVGDKGGSSYSGCTVLQSLTK